MLYIFYEGKSKFCKYFVMNYYILKYSNIYSFAALKKNLIENEKE